MRDKDCWFNQLIEEQPQDLNTRLLHGWLAWSNEVIEVSHQRQIGIDICMVLFAEASNSLKPDIQPGRMSGAVSGQALLEGAGGTKILKIIASLVGISSTQTTTPLSTHPL